MISPLPRLHALDGLRAAMMLLGIVLHSAVSYTVTPLGEAWPYQDAQTSRLFDFIVFIIHLFRMPTFFVMAGFFAAFLYYRDGVRGFLRHRVRRIVLPLVIFWLLLAPVVSVGFLFALARRHGWDAAWAQLNSASTAGPSLMHLWFLYYLLIFYIVAVGVLAVGIRLRINFRERVDRLVGGTVPGFASIAILSAVTMATLVPMKVPALETSVTFIPAFRVLVAYLVFFAFGWMLFNRRDVVPAFARRAWMYFGAGLITSGVYMAILLRPVDPIRTHFAGIAAASIATWLLIYACIGLFVRYFESPRPVQRYIADGAYWIYLVHLPFTISIAGLLAGLALPAFVKFLIVLTGTALVTVVTYHYFVRATRIGVLLNGRKYPRALPERIAPTIVGTVVGGGL